MTPFEIKKELGRYKRYYRSIILNLGNPVKIFNDVPYLNVREHWLRRFCISRGIENKLEYSNNTLSFIGIHDNPEWTLNHNSSKYKIFTTWENVHVDNWGRRCHYNYFQDRSDVNLALGFDYGDSNRYLRFPFWLLWNFKPESTYEDILSICKHINDRSRINFKQKLDFCSFICRKDYFGDRTEFANLVESIGSISFPSDFRHNDDRLRLQYNNDKLKYLNNFKFNLCPENANNYGYVTEKIFDAFIAGCIPIYWGNEGQPEPDIITPNSFIYLDKENETATKQALLMIKELNNNNSLLKEFLTQPVFTRNAAEVIYEYYIKLEEKIKDIINK